MAWTWLGNMKGKERVVIDLMGMIRIVAFPLISVDYTFDRSRIDEYTRLAFEGIVGKLHRSHIR